jgi:hypothetical protein
MKKIVVLSLLLKLSFSYCQIKSGEYDDGLNLAYNPINNLITGFYENYTGLDEETNNPRFSCVFYIKGVYKKSKIGIESYSPLDKEADLINGEIKLINLNTIAIKLQDEHGGCWNVQPFKDEFVTFSLYQKKNWIEIRYINTPKSYFYKNKTEESKQKSYLVKGDIIYIDKIEDKWIHCIYKANKTVSGWIKIDTLNKP